MSGFIKDCIKYGVAPYGATAGGGSGSVAADVIFDAKGDLPVGAGPNAATRLPVGTNGQVLVADSLQTTGLKWDTAPAGTPASSVVSEVTFGAVAAVGISTNYARQDHTHGTPTDPIPAHIAAGDPHPQYALDTDLASKQPLDSQLTDLAALSYTTNASKVVRVNSGATAFELVALAKSDVGLANVDNTADSVKSVANATEWAGAALTISNLAPTGGADGDIWFQYT